MKRKILIQIVTFCICFLLFFSSCRESKPEPNIAKTEETTEITTNLTELTDASESEVYLDDEKIQTQQTFNELIISVLSSKEGGDSTILRYGNTEILIDTALGDVTLETVSEIMSEDEDHTWEYVIFTHPDSDHIGKANDLFELFDKSEWTVEHIIDFGVGDSDSQESEDEKKILSAYKKLIKSHDGIDYFSPNQDLSETSLIKEYPIDSNFQMEVLYQECYGDSNDNNQSVCVLFQLGKQKMLFTGDLEKKGEESLLKYHSSLIKNVTFFKAGHHGSSTSNTQSFIDWIRPAYVAVTYHPSITEADLVWNIAKFIKYTDYIFPTRVKGTEEDTEPLLLFGRCDFVFDGYRVNVSSEYSQGCTIKEVDSKGTSWYWNLVERGLMNDEINAYFLDENMFVDQNGVKETFDKSGNLSYFNCTIIKYGHYDVLIDCGSVDLNSEILLEKLNDYVVDGVIECMIVSHYHLPSYSLVVGSTIDEKSVLDSFVIEKIIDNSDKMTNNSNIPGTAYSAYLTKVYSSFDRISLGKDESTTISLCNGLELNVYRGSNKTSQNNEDDYSLITVIDFYDDRMIFVGDLTDYTSLLNNYKKEISNAKLLRFSSSYTKYDSMENLSAFLKNVSPEIIVIGSPINHWNNGQTFMPKDSISNFETYVINETKNTSLKFYSCGYVDEKNVTKSVSGDLDFTLFKENQKIGDEERKWYITCSFNGGKGKKSKLTNSYYAFLPDDIRDYPIE